jgi:hypothetical protein
VIKMADVVALPRGVHLFLRTRRLLPVAVASACASFALGLARDLTVKVPFAPDTTTVDLFLLSPLIAAVLAGPSLEAHLAPYEAMARHRMMWLRGIQLAVVLLVVLAMAVPFGGKPVTEAPSLARNGLLLLALVLAWGVLVDVQTAWLPAVLYAALCFYVGKRNVDGAPRHWAVLIRPLDAETVAVACALFAVAGVLYVVCGPRGGA